MFSFLQGDIHSSPKCRSHYGRENSNAMLLDVEIRSDSGTQNVVVEEESSSAMRMATGEKEESKYASVAIAALKNQPKPSLNQAVQYQGIDFKKTKVSWSHDTHMTQHNIHVYVYP